MVALNLLVFVCLLYVAFLFAIAFGGVVCFEIKGDAGAVKTFMDRLQVFTVAESLGAVESLVGQPATMSHSSVPPEVRREMGIQDTLVRLSIGIEGIDDLVADLGQALKGSESRT